MRSRCVDHGALRKAPIFRHGTLRRRIRITAMSRAMAITSSESSGAPWAS
jgi:hypothetical protein